MGRLSHGQTRHGYLESIQWWLCHSVRLEPQAPFQVDMRSPSRPASSCLTTHLPYSLFSLLARTPCLPRQFHSFNEI
jgi:hypothetical protein